MKLQTRLIILLLLLSLIPLLIVSYLGYLNQRQALLKKTVEQLISLADTQEARVNEKLDRYLEQVKLVTSRTQLRNSLDSFNQTGSPVDLARIHTIIEDARISVSIIRDISIFDLEGNVVASTDDTRRGTRIEDTELLRLGERVIALKDIFADDNNKLSVRLVGPLILDGVVLGVAEVIASASPITIITEDYTGLGETGEVVLARRNATGDALFLTPLRFDSGAALTRAIPREQSRTPIIPAVFGEERVFVDRLIADYRGQSVFAVTRSIEALNWGLVVKIDQDEALSSVAALARAYTSIVSVSVFVIFLMTFLVVRDITRPIISLKQAADRLQSGKFDKRVEIESQDEIGELSMAFNTMTERLKTAYETLEDRVREKTQDLSGALQKMKEQNATLERTKEAMLNLLEDIEGEKRKIEEARAKDEAIFANIGDGLIVTDLDRKIVLSNASAWRMLGYSENELLGKLWPDMTVPSQEYGESNADFMIPIIEALEKRKTISTTRYDHSFKRKDGTLFPVAVTASPVVVRDELIGAVVAFRDVTHEMEIDQAKTEFVSLASHQLRTPLSTINWYAEMLLDGDAGKLSDQQAEYLQEIYAGNQRMVDLVNALLNVSRIELGTFAVDPEPTNLHDLIQSVVDELKPVVLEKELNVSIETDPDLPDVSVDPKLMRIVFQNLLTNALKYTPPKGSVGVGIALRKKGETVGSFPLDRDSFYVAVSDTGYGIPEKQKAKIFTKLFRADNVREKDTEGTGLGLYIVKSIIEHSEGHIWFESEEDKGTTFYILLPKSGMKERTGSKPLEVKKEM